MRCAIVESGRISNVVEWDGVTPLGLPQGVIVVPSEDGSVGDAWGEDVVALVAAVNAHEAAAFARGFEFRGVRFSLSLASQISLQGAAAASDALPYPFAWASRDDLESVVLDGPTDVIAMYGAAMGAVLAIRVPAGAASRRSRTTRRYSPGVGISSSIARSSSAIASRTTR